MSAPRESAQESEGMLGQAASVADGATTATELVERSLERIAETQGTLNAFRVVFAEQARAEAAEADRRIARGERLPLFGVPVAVKDDTDYAGATTPFGCGGAFATAAEDAAVVRRLREAGAIVIGKTNAPEVGQWPISDTKAFGIVRNPYNLDHTPGGSSGGSASAVAAGIVSAAVGSDGGGSVRIPASWTNLVGIKPQRGRISTYPVPDYGYGISVHGPLTRSVADAAALFDVLAGDNHISERYRPDPLPEPLSNAVGRDVGKLKIAVCTNMPFTAGPQGLDPEIRAATLRIADVLADLGHEVQEHELSYGPVGATWIIRGSVWCRKWVKEHVPDEKLLDPRTRASVRAGSVFRPALKGAIAAERSIAAKIGRVFDWADVVLMPTTAEPPFRAGAMDGLREMKTNAIISRACPYTFAWNITGWPGINVPAGFAKGNLPIGVQLLARDHSEPLLVAVASQLEERERWHERRPEALVGV